VFVATSSCSHPSRPDPEPTESGPKPGIYHVASGDRLDREELLGRLSSVPYIVFGERHDSRWQHRRQASLYRALTGEVGRDLALGMEMFQRPFQQPLDAYVAGEIDEATMLERTEWESRWGFEARLYRPLWRRAKAKGLPVVALNLRREISERIARVGLEGLEADLRERLPPRIDTSIASQREYVRRAFERHEMSGTMEFEPFLEAQAAWDETMAATALEALRERDRLDGIFIVAGRAHARADFGIPRRLERRLSEDAEGSVVSILPVDRRSGVDLAAHREAADADFIWIGPSNR